ncbi:hypothetical protein QFZ82_000585 [Streptomyces sp. V4I23]|nr:hypothetical protein [Streptomyces sp. V4I23]MDQ1006100.1 hypothetical protein [Streptomyces sp. V4I23]
MDTQTPPQHVPGYVQNAAEKRQQPGIVALDAAGSSLSHWPLITTAR